MRKGIRKLPVPGRERPYRHKRAQGNRANLQGHDHTYRHLRAESAIQPTEAGAYLYLGPRDLQLSESEPRPAEISSDKEYMAELQRRANLFGDGPINPGKLLNGESNPFLYDSDFLQKAIQKHCQRLPDPPCVTPPEVRLSDRP
jgi:hypothetical protein